MSEKDRNLQIAEDVLRLVGGKENVAACAHCMTRLRMAIKDWDKIDRDGLKQTDGVIGLTQGGGLFMIIIGQNVPKVHEYFIQLAGCPTDAVQVDDSKGFKKVLNRVLGYVSPTMLGIIPVMVGGGMAKTFAVLLGPTLLNIISDTSPIYLTLTMLFDTQLYFLPVELGYTACKTLKVDPLYGIFFGALLITPSFLAHVDAADGFKIFGLPTQLANYSQSFLPIILTVVVLKYVWAFAKKVSPETVATITVPLITMVVVTPIMFCLIAPLGDVLGKGFGFIFSLFNSDNVFIRCAGIMFAAVVSPYVITTGMHHVIINMAVMNFLQQGYEGSLFPGSVCYSFAIYTLPLVAFFKVKNKAQKSANLSYALTGYLGGISEPALYGCIFHYKGAALALALGSAIGGLVGGILSARVYILAGCNIFSVFGFFAAGGSKALASGLIMTGTTIVATFILGMIIPDYEVEL